MASVAITAPMNMTEPDGCAKRMVPIKSAEVVNWGDLIFTDTNGQVVPASKTGGAVVPAAWIADFPDENGMATSRIGVAGLTVKVGLCKRARLKNANSTLVPSLAKGAAIYLGPLPTATVSNYTCAKTATNTDKLQQVGFVEEDGTTLNIDLSSAGGEFVFQTSGNSVVGTG